MVTDLKQTRIFKKLSFLGNTDKQARVYEGKLLETLPHIQEVLESINIFFPHYTSHNIQHSITIIHRIGQLLPQRIINKLSSTEFFLIIAASLFHDTGMVLSQKEQNEIDRSQEYQDYYTKKYSIDKIKLIESEQAKMLTKRYIVAEFLRERHPQRSANFVLHIGKYLDPFAPQNSRLIKFLAKICEAHGLAREILEDDHKFPKEIDINGDPVNVKFLAAYLRIGDLLDMDHDRACPFIMNLKSPMPSGSIEHWSRHYLDDFYVSSKQIRVGKKCRNGEEYQILYQWTNWLKSEIEHTAAMLGQDSRLPFTPPLPIISIEPFTSQETTSSIIAPELPDEIELEFMSDEYIVQLKVLWQKEAEPDDYLRITVRTTENSEAK